MRLLVTGGAGFIGSNFIHFIIDNHPDWEISNLDNLTYAGNLANLRDVEDEHRYHFIKGDICDRILVSVLFKTKFDAVVNFAAESHVDRSIADSTPFIDTNIKGTQVLLEEARNAGSTRFLQVSTDEVYGSLDSGKSHELSNIQPNSPYAASKAAADLLCRSYWKTFGLPVMISRCSNNYGPYQFPEKLIPLVITNAVEGRNIPVYGDGLNVREWIHVQDHCRALERIILEGKAGEIYNIGSGMEKTNLDIIRCILGELHKSEDLIQFVRDRRGHDRRYALDSTKIRRELEWEPVFSFEEGIRSTVNWYTGNEGWWSAIKSGDYSEYYRRMYTGR